MGTVKKKSPPFVGYLLDSSDHFDWMATPVEGDTVEEIVEALPKASELHSHAVILNTKTWETSEVFALLSR